MTSKINFLSPLCKTFSYKYSRCLVRGRTEATKTHYSVKEWEEIRYVEVIRLYLHICKYDKFPVGHVYVAADCPFDCLNRKWQINVSSSASV